MGNNEFVEMGLVESVFEDLKIPKKALWVRELIIELIHNKEDYLELLLLIDKRGREMIVDCLLIMQRRRK